MEKRILLIYPSYSYPRKSPPLGLAYLASSLENAGYKVVIIDLNVTPMNDGAFSKFLKHCEWLFVGLSFMTNQFTEAKRLSKVIKNVLPNILLIAGGPHASSIPEQTLKELQNVDVVAYGEGEETIIEVAEYTRQGKSLDTIQGLCLRKNNETIKNLRRPLIEKLDQLPYPAWSHLQVDNYNVFSIKDGGGAPVFALLSSRGCPNNCIFCDSHTIFLRKFRARSAANIFQEIMFLHSKYGMKVFDFVDDLITVSKPRILELCQLLKASSVSFQWMANARVNTVDGEMLAAMKNAGCIRVDFGVESGDPAVRTMMRKNVTDQQIRQAHIMATELGLSTGSFTMVGNLGEKRRSVEMTARLLSEIGDDVMVSIACPYPGTQLYRLGKDKGYINTEDWSRYVTSPTYTENYRPVMRTDLMTEEEILDCYYYLNSFFVKKKFQRRYGKFFYLKPRFLSDWIFSVKGLKRRINMVARILKSRLS